MDTNRLIGIFGAGFAVVTWTYTPSPTLNEYGPWLGLFLMAYAIVFDYIDPPADTPVIEKLTRDDRYLLAVKFKAPKHGEFSMPSARQGTQGYLTLETAQSRISRMVDLGVLSVTPNGSFKLTQTGSVVLEEIDDSEADPDWHKATPFLRR